MDDRPVSVVVARPRFSSELAWEEMGPIVEAAGGPPLAIACCEDRGLLDHLSRHQPDVVVPSTGLVGAAEIEMGSFRLIQQFGVGLDNVDVEAATCKGIWVANMPGLNAAEVAEHAVLLLLALLRRLPEAAAGFAPDGWGTPPVRSLLGSRVAIVGFGAIGAAIASRLLPFGVEIEALTRRPDRHSGDAPGIPVHGLDRLPEVASRADAVILAAAQGAGQAPLVDRDLLAGMRRDAILVNVGRGGLIDDEALLEALDQGRIAAAGLDVFRDEPVAADHPLVAHPRTLCTAHVAALSYRYFRAAAERLGAAIAAVEAGEPPPFAVNSPRA